MNPDSQRLQEAHDKGEQDAAKGIYEEPNGILDFLAASVPFLGDKEQLNAENEAYQQGQQNHQNQT